MKNVRIYDLVKNELTCKFGNIDNIIFHYTVIKESDKRLNIIVYCVNIENLPMLKKEKYNGETFIKVNLIQNYIVSYLSEHIQEKDYFFAFRYKRNIYFLLVNSNNLVANRVIKVNKNLNGYTQEFVRFLEDYKEEYNYINKIYTLDMNLLNAELNNFIVVKLRELSNRDFLSYVILKG